MGCGSSSAAASPVEKFGKAIACVGWGVLGETMGSSPWDTKAVAPKPDGTTIIVDPASTQIKNPGFTPGSAGGAAGAIYRFLGIAENDTFPPDVVSSLNAIGDACYKRYGHPQALHVIHVIGPDFKKMSMTRDEAVEELTAAYCNVLKQAASQGRRLLRLVPISSGIYAGPFKAEMAEITAEALLAGFEKLEPAQQASLAPHEGRSVELCLFDPSEVKQFATAIQRLLTTFDSTKV